MSNIIIEGVLQKFNNKHNGRIYPKEAFKKIFRDDVRKLIRKKKIKKLFYEE
jgi:hypothetical protein